MHIGHLAPLKNFNPYTLFRHVRCMSQIFRCLYLLSDCGLTRLPLKIHLNIEYHVIINTLTKNMVIHTSVQDIKRDTIFHHLLLNLLPPEISRGLLINIQFLGYQLCKFYAKLMCLNSIPVLCLHYDYVSLLQEITYPQRKCWLTCTIIYDSILCNLY